MKNLDNFLNIYTKGTHELEDPSLFEYNRTESTEYRVLNKLFKNYSIQSHDKLVDFGAGKGRILFYVHYYHNIPVTGIEMNELSFADLQKNRINYFNKHSGNADEITLMKGLVEDYEVRPEDTLFYFFNPFSLNVFKDVMKSIQQSLRNHPRQADIIFYYPSQNLKDYIIKTTAFKELQKIETTWYRGYREHISIFRSQPIIN